MSNPDTPSNGPSETPAAKFDNVCFAPHDIDGDGLVDPGGVAIEDLAVADLDGDGDIDIVAVGRATHNVRIYWNQLVR